jgi:hypothetical protein
MKPLSLITKVSLLFIVFMGCLVPYTSKAQIIEHFYGKEDVDESAWDVEKAYDGGFLIGAKISEEVHGNWKHSGYILKVDINGDTLWWREFPNVIAVTKIKQVDNGNIFVSMSSASGSNWASIVTCMNPCGEVIWCKKFVADDHDGQSVLDMAVSEDRIILLHRNTVYPFMEYYMITLDYQGRVVDDRQVCLNDDYPDIIYTQPDEIKVFPNNKVMIMGTCRVEEDYQRTKSFYEYREIGGEKLWGTFAGSGMDCQTYNVWDHSIFQNEEGDFLAFVNGGTLYDSTRLFCFNINKDGYISYYTERRFRYIFNLGKKPFLNCVRKLEENKYVATFHYEDTAYARDKYRCTDVVMDSTMEIFYDTLHYNYLNISFRDQLLTDNDLVKVGYYYNGNDSEIFFNRIDPYTLEYRTLGAVSPEHDFYCPAIRYADSLYLENCDILGTYEIGSLRKGINVKVYPNPVNTQMKISISGLDANGEYTGIIKTIEGRDIKQIVINSTEKTALSVENWNPGIYFLQVIKNGEPVDCKKFIVMD